MMSMKYHDDDSYVVLYDTDGFRARDLPQKALQLTHHRSFFITKVANVNPSEAARRTELWLVQMSDRQAHSRNDS